MFSLFRRKPTAIERELAKLADAVERSDPDRGDRRSMRRLEDFQAVHQTVLELRQYRLSRRGLLETPRFYVGMFAIAGAAAFLLLGSLRVDEVKASIVATVDGVVFEVSDGPASFDLLPGARLRSLSISQATVLTYPGENGNLRVRRSEQSPLYDIVLRAEGSSLTINKLIAQAPHRLAVETGLDSWSAIAAVWAAELNLEIQVTSGVLLEVTKDGARQEVDLLTSREVDLVKILAADVQGLSLEWTREPAEAGQGYDVIRNVVPANELDFVRESEAAGARTSTIRDGAIVFPELDGKTHALRAPQRLLGEEHGHVLTLVQYERDFRLWWEGKLENARIGTPAASQDVMPRRIEALIGGGDRQLILIVTFYLALIVVAILRGNELSTLRSISPSLPKD